MNKTNPDPVSPELLGHFAAFQSRGGLFRLNLRHSLRRLAWRRLVGSADSAKRVLDVAGIQDVQISLDAAGCRKAPCGAARWQ